MKKIFWLGMIVFFTGMPAYAQKIQYSRQTVKALYSDDLQLVPNIEGNHHLLRLFVNKKPVIYVFNNQLQLQAEKTIGLKLRENMETRVLPFRNHYLFYAHTQNTSTHELYKVDADGTVTLLSVKFQEVVNSVLNQSSASLQLVNQNEKLLVIANVYYDQLKKVISTVIELNTDMQVASEWKVSFDFNFEENRLQQALLCGNSLLVTKTGGNQEQGHLLDILKIDLATGKSLLKTFTSNKYPYTNTSLVILPKDSTILVHAILGAGTAGARMQYTGFITHLGQSLNEITPFALLQSQLRAHTDARYFLLSDYSCWVNLNSNFFKRRRGEELLSRLRGRNTYNTPITYNSQPSPYNVPTLPDDAQILPNAGLNLPATTDRVQGSTDRRRPSFSTATPNNQIQTMVRFTVLNNQLKPTRDSTASVNKNEFGMQPLPYAQFNLNNKACLFLLQTFTENKRGLVMISAEKNAGLTTTNINVNYKYEYLLHQMQAVNSHSVLLPYTHKNEAGLIKISFD